MLRRIQRCTQEEAQRVLQAGNWRMSLHEPDAFLTVVYACGAHKAAKIKEHYINYGINYRKFQLFLTPRLV